MGGVESVRATEPDPIFALIESIRGCTRPTATRPSPTLGFLTDSRRQSARNFLREGCGLGNANPCALSWGQRPFFAAGFSRAHSQKQALCRRSVGTNSLLKLPD